MNDAKVWVEISRSALEQNMTTLRSRTDAQFMAVIKSNAYGHGLLEVGQIATDAGVDWFGVDSIDEALRLREVGIEKPILVLGYTLLERLEDAVDNNISLIAYNKETIDALEALGKSSRVHIKIETGTSRQGLHEQAAVDLAEYIKSREHVTLEACSTHYANIEDTTDHVYAQEQLTRFKEITEKINPPLRHTACSAALILFPETHFDLVRAGISLYGHWSSPQTRVSANGASSMELRAALTWKTRVAQIKRIPKDTPVSYGLTETVHRDSKLAVLPVGYWDGYDRKLSSVGEVLIRGARAKVIGRVCMNMIVVDVTDIPDVAPEDEVVLLGTQGNQTVSAEDLAAKVGTIQYEFLTRINPTLPRVIVE